jgi:hypothetical protein
MNTLARRLSLLTVMLGLLSTQNAAASPITVDYTGVITNLWDFNPGGTAFTMGESFSGSFTFDSDVPATGGTRTLTALSWSTNTYSASLATIHPEFSQVQITDPSAADLGVNAVFGYVTGPPVPGLIFDATPWSLSLNLHDTSDFALYMDFYDVGGFRSELLGRLTSVTVHENAVVPEPTTLVLLGTGLVCCAARRKRRVQPAGC